MNPIAVGRMPRRRLLIGAAVVWVTLALAVAAADAPDKRERFAVLEASTRLVDEVYRLDARIRYELTPEATEALNSGVPMVIELQIEVFEPRDFLWDRTVAELVLRHRIEYRALADRYLVTNLSTGELSSHTNLTAALATLGRVRDFPMLDRRLLRVGNRHDVRLRASLDIESLPLPLRPVAYLSSAWDLTSEWHAWLLTP